MRVNQYLSCFIIRCLTLLYTVCSGVIVVLPGRRRRPERRTRRQQRTARSVRRRLIRLTLRVDWGFRAVQSSAASDATAAHVRCRRTWRRGSTRRPADTTSLTPSPQGQATTMTRKLCRRSNWLLYIAPYAVISPALCCRRSVVVYTAFKRKNLKISF